MRSDYARAYAGLYRTHAWWRAREELLLGVLDEVVPKRPIRILDIGCGDGLFFEPLRRFGSVEGIEPDPEMVSPDSPERAQIFVGSLQKYSATAAFDLVLLLDVIEHAENDVALLQRAASLLTPGGIAVITVPALQALWTHHDDVNAHQRRYTRASLANAIRDSGLAQQSSRYFFASMVPLKLVVRAKERVVGAGADTSRAPHWLPNAALLKLLRLENRVTRRLHLPVGSSLLAVARK